MLPNIRTSFNCNKFHVADDSSADNPYHLCCRKPNLEITYMGHFEQTGKLVVQVNNYRARLKKLLGILTFG